jgi:hypothetical protein
LKSTTLAYSCNRRSSKLKASLSLPPDNTWTSVLSSLGGSRISDLFRPTVEYFRHNNRHILLDNSLYLDIYNSEHDRCRALDPTSHLRPPYHYSSPHLPVRAGIAKVAAVPSAGIPQPPPPSSPAHSLRHCLHLMLRPAADGVTDAGPPALGRCVPSGTMIPGPITDHPRGHARVPRQERRHRRRPRGILLLPPPPTHGPRAAGRSHRNPPTTRRTREETSYCHGCCKSSGQMAPDPWAHHNLPAPTLRQDFSTRRTIAVGGVLAGSFFFFFFWNSKICVGCGLQ